MAAYKPWKWGTDVTVATGTMEGGISITTDADFNMYAARCTTYNAITANAIKVYKSTDAGYTWQPFTFFYSSENASYAWPQLLTCNKGDSSFLYVFQWRSDQNGSVRLRKYTLSGLVRSTMAMVTGGTDTITYYSVCSNLAGDSIAIAYEWHQTGDETPNISLIRSLNYGNTWSSPVAVYFDGSQPDIAYSAEKRLFLVAREVDPEFDIHIRRSVNFGSTWTEATVELTADADEDGFPKIAAEHDTLASGATIWVIYNHYTSSSDIDLYYAYSTDGGNTWTKNQVLAQSTQYDEVAGEVITLDHYTGWPLAFVCYLKNYFDILHFTETVEIYFTYANADSASKWMELTKINDYKAAFSLDSREVCQEAMYPAWIIPVPG
ncbi:MAG TPA: sialidase family protein, partial [candidate division Zixibacteria bacterium]